MMTGNQGLYDQATIFSPQPIRIHQGLSLRSHSGRGYVMEALPSRINAHGERNGFHGTGDKRNILSLRDPKGQFMFCIRCGLTSGGKRPILLCDYCPCAWHMDCLPFPMANPPDQKSGSDKIYNNWMCPNHIDHDLQELSEAGATTGKASRRPPCSKFIDIDVLPTSELEESTPKMMIPRKRAAPSDETQSSVPSEEKESGEANYQGGADSRDISHDSNSGPHPIAEFEEVPVFDSNTARASEESSVLGFVERVKQEHLVRTSLKEFYRAMMGRLSVDQLERLQNFAPPQVSREFQRREDERLAAEALVDMPRYEVLFQEKPADEADSLEGLRRLLGSLKDTPPERDPQMEEKGEVEVKKRANGHPIHKASMTTDDEPTFQGEGTKRKSLDTKDSSRSKRSESEIEILRSLRQLVDQRVLEMKKKPRKTLFQN